MASGLQKRVIDAPVSFDAAIAGVFFALEIVTGECMAAELTGQWHLLPVFLVLHVAAKQVAERTSPKSLYAIATPTPAQP